MNGPLSDYAKKRVATSNAFDTLIAKATELGLKLNPVGGLMYMPTQEVTAQFQAACRAVLDALLIEKPCETP